MPGFDCHAHCFNVGPFRSTARHRPQYRACPEVWLGHLKRNSLDGGVVVQPSFLDDENALMIGLLKKLGPQFRGVAVLSDAWTESGIAELAKAGVVGSRWNLLGRANRLPSLASRHRELDVLEQNGMHLQIHIDAPNLRDILASIPQGGVPIVIDHLGRPEAGDPNADEATNAIIDAKLKGADIWVKISAPYRSGVKDLKNHFRRLVAELGQNRLVWGSDWPFTQHEDTTSYDGVFSWARDICEDETLWKKILVKNPTELYRFEPAQSTMSNTVKPRNIDG